MKRFLKVFSLVLALLMLSFVLPSCGEEVVAPFVIPTRNLSDTTEYTEGVYKYMLFDDETVVIIEHTGNEADIVIPATLGGYKVSTIGSAAFYANDNATSVTIPEGVETIGSSAFNGCMKLQTVNIPKSVWEICADAFTDTPWLQSFANEEFVTVGDSVLLQYNGNATSVVIPDTIKHIGAAFVGNETIKSVVVPDSVYTIGHAAFSGSTVSRVELGNNVALIGDSAFNACSELYYINMPDSLKRIEAYAFGSCSGLNYIKIGKNVEYIGYAAFERASQLNYIYLPKSLVPTEQNKYDEEEAKTIEDLAFDDCGSLAYVFFEGTQADFDKISLSGGNSYLADAERIYGFEY